MSFQVIKFMRLFFQGDQVLMLLEDFLTERSGASVCLARSG